MENSNFEETMPTKVGRDNGEPAETQPVKVSPSENQDMTTVEAADHQVVEYGGTGLPGRSRLGWRSWTAIGIIGLLAIALISALGGYSNGISQREHAQSTQIALTLDEQYILGVQDLEAHNYDLARQRFEYIINANPLYPGAAERLADALLALNTKATPTIAATPTLTPTPDLRSVEEKFSQAQQHLANSQWTEAIDSLLSLRKADINYQAVWVDGMLYTAFRSRGKDKILLNGDLEGGIYDLTVAQLYGFLDYDSRGLLNWSTLYITGASFWEIDWAQAVYYFAQVAPAVPNLRDGSGWTATERYRLALIGYAGYLADQKEWCAAMEQYQLALTYGPDAEVEALLPDIINTCTGGEDEGESSGGGDETPSPTTEETPVVTEPPPTEPPPTEPPPTEPPPDSTPMP